MYITMYADPVQGITITFVNDSGAYAVPTFYDGYMDELIAMMTVNGNDVEKIYIHGNPPSFCEKIVQEVQAEYPNVIIETNID